ncbi:protein phosphatase 2C domain-containing protein [Streptomyces pratensis]|uniref:protein phosphatase 2C domain-containing protein n=1 Tax=Streptomyces pratensis TaxID=1169025 RepID=UPI0030179A4D
MSQQGEKPTAHEDEWWRKLYDVTAPDAGAGSAADSLDDRFDSVSDTVGGDHRDAARGSARGACAEEREGPPRSSPAQAYGPPEPTRPAAPPGGPVARAASEPEPSPASVPVPRPEPAAPASAPVPEPVSGSTPPLAARRRSASSPRPPAPARPAAPRTVAFPAPWEPPSGPPGPRTFAAPGPGRPAGPVEAGDAPGPSADATAPVRPVVRRLGDRPPTYDADPGALPAATSQSLEGLAPDTVLDGARYGTYTLRAASVRGDLARFRGEPRRDALLTARFGDAESALVLVAVAGGTRAGEAAHLAAADACRWIGGSVARSHARLSADIRAGRRDALRSGLHRLTDRTYGKLRARAAAGGVAPAAYTASLRCLLLSADPDCRTRVFFGTGGGGLFRLRDGLWQDLEPLGEEGGAPQPSPGRKEKPREARPAPDAPITVVPAPDGGSRTPRPAELFRFRASVARPGDMLLLCGAGLAEPMRGEPALPEELARRWGTGGPPGLPAFLADVQLRVKGYADDRTAAAVWEA